LSNGRFLILALVLVLGIAASVLLGKLGKPFAAVGYRDLKIPFEEFPRQVGRWVRSEDDPLSPRELEILGQDRYLRRVYEAEDGAAVRLFVCYYGNKDRGLEAIFHNPTICLPAAGFKWVESERRRVTLRDAAMDFDVSIDRFRNTTGDVLILNFFILDGDVMEQSPRNEPFRLALEKFKPSTDPGYFVQVQVVPLATAKGEKARETAVSFVEEAMSYIFRHF
jgi:EpsI family protein